MNKLKIYDKDSCLVEQGELTKDDYIRAASIISRCRDERLSYVIMLLKQAGFELPEVEQISRQVKTEVVSEGKLKEYVEKVMKMGVIHKNQIYVTIADFNDFCMQFGISPIKYKRWLYHNEYIKTTKSENGKLDYTITVRINGETRRCIVFEL